MVSKQEIELGTDEKLKDPLIPPYSTKVRPWNPNTVLIIGDSMLNGIDESLLSKSAPVKVRSFSGAVIRDMYDFIQPLMERKPGKIILHVGTNDIPYGKSAEDIMCELLRLKTYIMLKYKITPIISWPIIRADYDGKWAETVTDIWRALDEVSIPSIRNTDISPKMLNDKGRFPGLHLNKWGRARLAMNFLSFLRKC